MAEQSESGNTGRLSDSEKVAEDCEAIDAELATLKAAYEQYFLGMERHPPIKQHADLQKRIRKLKGAFVRQTAMKFRVQSLHSKFLTYERLWARTLQEIEAGTYKRDLFKARRRSQQAAPKKEKAAEEPASFEVEELDDFDLEPVPLQAGTTATVRAPAPVSPLPVPGVPKVASSTGIPAVPKVTSSPGVPAVPKVASSPAIPAVPKVPSSPGVPAVPQMARPAPAGVPAVPAGLRPATNPGMPAVSPPVARSGSSPAVPKPTASTGGAGAGAVSEARLKAVYDAYVIAKKRCQEDVSKLSYEAVAANLRKQVPELMKKHNASGVEFKVVIKDGKAVLKAVPK